MFCETTYFPPLSRLLYSWRICRRWYGRAIVRIVWGGLKRDSDPVQSLEFGTVTQSGRSHGSKTVSFTRLCNSASPALQPNARDAQPNPTIHPEGWRSGLNPMNPNLPKPEDPGTSLATHQTRTQHSSFPDNKLG